MHGLGERSFLPNQVQELFAGCQFSLLVEELSQGVVGVARRPIGDVSRPNAFPVLFDGLGTFALLDAVEILLHGFARVPSVTIDVVIDGSVKKGELRVQVVAIEDLP